jgi:hypothetical protein
MDERTHLDLLERDIDPRYLSRPVLAIHLVATPNRENRHVLPDLTPTNHWMVFLEVAAAASASVAVNMRYEPRTHPRGALALQSKRYACTDRLVKRVTVRPVGVGGGGPLLLVRDVVELIGRNGLDRYDFDGVGEGCRYWNLVFLECLLRGGHVDQEGVDVARLALHYYWDYPGGHPSKEPRPIRPGRFYN